MMHLQDPRTQIALFAALFFLIVGSPTVYTWTDKFIGSKIGLTFAVDGAPTRAGLLVHAAVMAIGVYAYLKSYGEGGVTTSLTPSLVL